MYHVVLVPTIFVELLDDIVELVLLERVLFPTPQPPPLPKEATGATGKRSLAMAAVAKGHATVVRLGGPRCWRQPVAAPTAACRPSVGEVAVALQRSGLRSHDELHGQQRPAVARRCRPWCRQRAVGRIIAGPSLHLTPLFAH